MSYQRMLLKFSGEILIGKKEFGVSPEAVYQLAEKILEVHQAGIQLGIVMGGGNIFRGIQHDNWGLDRTPADQIGMLATVINGIALQQILQKLGAKVLIMSAFPCGLVEAYQWNKAMRALEEGYILLFVGGTGHPFFSTDTCAALRACELKADVLVKATTWVDGVYDKDPRIDPSATKYSSITYTEVLVKQLRIVDLSAIAMCMHADIPIRVCNFFRNNLLETLKDHTFGTLISKGT